VLNVPGTLWGQSGLWRVTKPAVYVANNESLLLVKPTIGCAVDHGGPRIVLLLELKPTLLWDAQ